MTPRELYEALRYQLAPVGVTTCGPCANEACREPARGGNKCADCLAEALYLAGYAKAWELAIRLRASRNAILDAEEWLYEQESTP